MEREREGDRSEVYGGPGVSCIESQSVHRMEVKTEPRLFACYLSEWLDCDSEENVNRS